MKLPRISVIIPALNEEKTIADVIAIARKGNPKLEVIVVDDNSTDNTVKIAKKAGVKVITSSLLGKGKSMEEGFVKSSGEVIVFLDADLRNLNPDVVTILTKPIIKNECDFVKARYSRIAGRVTEILAKPLLRIFFPRMQTFYQPLSGIMASKRQFLEKVNFEKNYGVDVGLLLDMVNAGARTKEIDIGHIEHKMKPLEELGKMSEEVAAAIIKRARMGTKIVQGGIIGELDIVANTIMKSKNMAISPNKAAFIDMDGTLINGRYILEATKKRGLENRVIEIINDCERESFEKANSIAQLLSGMHYNTLRSIAKTIPLMKNARVLCKYLRKIGYSIVILTDSYSYVANIIKRRIGADAIIANELGFSDGYCTGEFTLNSAFCPVEGGCRNHAVCKLNAAVRFCNELLIPHGNTIAIGDNRNDMCILRWANESIAFCSKDGEVKDAAKYVISKPDLKETIRTLAKANITNVL